MKKFTVGEYYKYTYKNGEILIWKITSLYYNKTSHRAMVIYDGDTIGHKYEEGETHTIGIYRKFEKMNKDEVMIELL